MRPADLRGSIYYSFEDRSVARIFAGKGRGNRLVVLRFSVATFYRNEAAILVGCGPERARLWRRSSRNMGFDLRPPGNSWHPAALRQGPLLVGDHRAQRGRKS